MPTKKSKATTKKGAGTKPSGQPRVSGAGNVASEVVGQGGEFHQNADPSAPAEAFLTDNFGHRISDNQNSLRAGHRGPTLLEDFVLREKIFHFDHERIPERIVHARGSAAHGEFVCTDPIPEFTQATILQRKGDSCPVFARISTVAGGAGSVDTPRDVRGFAVKFYTDAGNWDLVGNNIPVFFIQDAMKFPDLVHSVKMEADRGFPQAASAHDTFWDFIGLMPESMHMIMWAMSDRTIPRTLRMIEGFGVHTFRLVNAKGESRFAKFHWKPVLGIESTCWDEAVKIAGADPDFHRRDLYESIDRGSFPQWSLGVQIFDEKWAAQQPYDVLDATKLIPEEDIPVRIVGRMTLNRNPANFFAETEQSAFLPSNVIPGIDFSNDPLLQGRLFSYLDTQKSRLGTTNFHQIPINSPKCPFQNFQRDGMMQTHVPTGRANYEPNSLAQAGEEGGPRESPAEGVVSFPANAEGNDPREKLRVRAELFADHYSQARAFYHSQTVNEQAHIASAFVFELSKVQIPAVRQRILSHLQNVDNDLAARVGAGLGAELPPASPMARPPYAAAPSDALSIQKQPDKGPIGRCVGILIAEGSDASAIKALVTQNDKAGVRSFIVAPRIEKVMLSGGATMHADGQLAGSPSVLFDAVACVLTSQAARKLSRDAAAVQWLMDAYGHCKTIAHDKTSQPLLTKAGVEPDKGVVTLDQLLKVGLRRHWEREPKVRDLA